MLCGTGAMDTACGNVCSQQKMCRKKKFNEENDSSLNRTTISK